jgi:hypothetical protein
MFFVSGTYADRFHGRGEGVEDIPDAVCNECSLTFVHPALAGCCSFQMITLPSYEQDARICPNFGCAQATCHTGPVCLPNGTDEKDRSNSEGGPKGGKEREGGWLYPFSVWPTPRWGSPSTTSKTLTVRSEEHVARRLP